MSFDAASLLSQLRGLETSSGAPARYLVAFSGGLDSSVLLHALAKAALPGTVPVEAIHIDHGLHPDSADWARAAQVFSDECGVPCQVVRVDVGGVGGPEAAAREARYRALEAEMRTGDWLLSAHHVNDQAETLLLNLMRGSGPEGLAAMPAIRRFGPGYLVRPLLVTTRKQLLDYAEAAGIDWIDDPSNAELSFDRNYLRQVVLPHLERRWPEAAARIARSAAHAGDVAHWLRDTCDYYLQRMGACGGRIPLAGLRTLPASRAGMAIRRAVDLEGLPKITSTACAEILSTMLDSRTDATPVVRWAGAECRRYKDALYLHRVPEPPDFDGRQLAPGRPVALGPRRGEIALEAVPGAGLDPALAKAGLRLRRRLGGERIRPQGDAHTRQLKKLLQDRGVYPWCRDDLPLLYAGDRLVAVAHLWIDANAAAEPGYAICWRDAPALADDLASNAQLSAAGRSDNV